MLQRLPQPNRAHGGVRYFDGLTNDARLVLDTLRSASRQGPGGQLHATGEARPPARLAVTVRDVLTDRPYDRPPACVVNATGPWAPAVAA